MSELRRAALARIARRAREPRGAGAILPAARDAPLRASFAQERMWFLEQLDAGATTNQLPIGLHLDGPLDVPALERALGELVGRHESLRTALVMGDDGLRQVVRPPRLSLARADVGGDPDPAARARDLALAEAGRRFDLAGGELLRALLVRQAPERHLLLFHAHHVAADAWSMGLLFGELSALYGAFRQGRPSPLAEPALQHADYAAWQRERHDAGALAPELAYWRERLAGAPEVLELPRGGRGRPAGEARVPLALDGPALEAFARAHGATLFMVLLGGFSLLLARWSGQRDLLVGTPVANRGRPELGQVVGLLLNSLVLRCDLAGDPTGAELLARARETTAGAFAHAEAPFEQVVEALRPQREMGRRPLFQAMLDLYDAPPDRLRLEGLEVEIESFRTAVDFDLALIAMRSADVLRAGLEYDPERYDRAMVERMAGHLTRLLRALPEAPERRVSRLPLLTAAEREGLLRQGAGREVGGGEECVHRMFERVARERWEEEAVVGGGERVSYGELERRSNRVARWLRRRGVGPEVRVGIEMVRGVGQVAALLGVMKAGGVCVPLDPEYPEARREQMRAGVEVVVREVEEAEGEGSEVVESGVVGENLCYVLYTSGSSGRPKGVGYRHEGLSNLVRWQMGERGGGRRTLWYASASFDASFLEVMGGLCGGGVVVMASEEERRDVRELGRLVREAGVERATLPPVVLEQVAGEGGRRGEWRGLREVTATGERLVVTPELRQMFEGMGGCRLNNQMGPTETHVVVGYELGPEPGEWEALPAVGRPVWNTQVYVVDTELELVAEGVRGELCIGGVQLGRGYEGEAGQTAERFVPCPWGEAGSRMYRSGDEVRWRGGELEYVGRSDEQVKVRGQRVELGEVEAVLREHQGVREAVAGVRGEGVERRLVAWVVGEAGEAELRGWLRERLPEAMVPQLWVVMGELPKTASGKVARRELPEPEVVGKGEYVGPRTPEEEVLAGIWGEVLGAERVGVHDNYFELGGDSILSILIATRARRAGLELTPRHLFQHQTVAELATAVAPLPAEPAGDLPLLPLARDLLRAGLQQERLLVELAEPAPPDLLRDALAAVAARHDALRLTAGAPDGAWRLAVGEDQSPLVQAEADGGRLRLALPELAAGAASWSLLLADLEAACAQLRAGGPVELPAATTSLRAWSGRVAALAADPALAAGADAWAAHTRLEVVRLPLAGSAGGPWPAALVRAGLPADESAAVLDELPSVYPIEPSELLLAALAGALHAWTGGDAALVEVEASARAAPLPAAATARTVGRLACRFPLRLPLVPAERPGELLRAVKTEARAVPGGGLGHGLLRDLATSPAVRERLAAAPRPALGFAWLGEVAASPNGSLRPVAWEPPPALAGCVLEVTGLRLGGRLELCLRFAEGLVPAPTAEALAAGILAALRALAEHCLSGAESGYSAADFPDAGMTEAELEALLGALGDGEPGA